MHSRAAVVVIAVAVCVAWAPARAAETGKTGGGKLKSSGVTIDETAPKAVRGRVFLDANRNGRFDKDEKPLPGVRVTDGVTFAAAGADGAYEITISPDPLILHKPAQVVSVSWPTGTWPTGPWYRRLSDVKPGQAVDFALRPDEQTLPFTVAHGTDPHDAFRRKHNYVFRDDIVRAGGLVKLCFVTGDLTYIGPANYDREFTAIAQFTNTFPVPMFHTPGNHDLIGIHAKDWDKADPLYGNAVWTRYLGPVRWSFDYAGVHFVGLDWMYFKDGALECGTPKVAVDWLEKDLAGVKRHARTILFIHQPWAPTRRFWDVARAGGVVLMLGGHSHRNLDMSFGGVRALTTMSLYRLIRITRDALDIVDCCAYRNNGLGRSDQRHSRRCALHLPTDLPKRRGKGVSLANVTLDNAAKALGGISAVTMEIAVEIAPGTAGTYGLRIAPPGVGTKPVEVAFKGKYLLRAGDVETYSGRRPGNRTMTLRVVIDAGRMKVYANRCIALDRPLKLPRPPAVSLFARRGAAVFRTVDLRPLTPAPPPEGPK